MRRFVRLQQGHMTDLINRVNELESEVITTLLKKYQPVLEEMRFEHREDIPRMAYVLNIAVNYLIVNYKDLSSDWKTWCTILIKRLFEQEKLRTKKDILKQIDDFLMYKKKEYEKYIDNIALYSNEYHRDAPFIDKYLKQLL